MEEQTLEDRMADLLMRMKNTRPLWDGRTGLTPHMREDINELLRERQEAAK